ncbi:hypothetical protein C8Q75DRAFT_65993 [Abortiporus biennis]|nr:hypothetical protein C8Q75DRAFT_65993 [Abortiporus biennis]
MLNRWKSRHGRDSSHSPGHDEHETPSSISDICGVATCGCAQDRNCIGPMLARRLQEDIVSVVDTLKDHLRTRIEALTKEANKNAISSSVEAINDITKGISWHTLNALLRRKGSWRDHDLNNLVTQAYLSQLMKNWSSMIQTTFPIFEACRTQTNQRITNLLDEIIQSCSMEDMKKLTKFEGEVALYEDRLALTCSREGFQYTSKTCSQESCNSSGRSCLKVMKEL